jgi:hypothetical protein
MPLSDDDLLAFDRKKLGMLERAPRDLLEQHQDVYRAQLVVARWLDRYKEGRTSRPHFAANAEFEAGIAGTLNDIAAHLRKGDFLPGGSLYEDEVQRTSSEESPA